MFEISHQPIDLNRVIDAVTAAECGGISVFLGTVRNHSGGKPVSKLEYQAYEEMAVPELKQLAKEVMAECGCHKLAVIHRVGTLEIGDVAVVVAASAAHRKEAFSGCRTMIDRLKERVPIWKKEFGEDGATWIES